MQTNTNRVGINFGILLAIYYTIFNLGLFYSDVTLFTNKFIGMFNIAFIVIIGVITIYIARRKAGGYVTFREAFTPFLIATAIGVTVNYIVYYILFNLVDSSAKDTVHNIMMDMLMDTLNNSGLEQDQINDQIAKAKDLDQFTLRSMLFLWAGSILRNSVIGLLLAAIFKNKSEFIQPLPAEPAQKEETQQ
ncbi:DUF4199 domain-containing protein [Myroides pelagicus]|uniref:DUF4199 family protein n=1 Tax=Myroides pelagicus TaxID=270914 RepID=A0A7K1GM79_9FLAO|nr:DUF4199 domain-containing protein [Myroides pelagicus]MEC4114323.1 DUF4199 domain-containing protein [Myroides pelagicus]MTH29850.1 DUF4199 family protein [Myroides pelagicus]